MTDGTGNFYGTTEAGGIYGSGSVYKITSTGNYSLIYSFYPTTPSATSPGRNPSGGLVSDGLGNFYGGVARGYADERGIIYKISATGNLTYIQGVPGEKPQGELLIDSAGDLYGTTAEGGQIGGVGMQGVVYKINPITLESKTLHTFYGDLTEGGAPSGLVSDGAGGFYGTTSIAVYKISNTGAYSILHRFRGGYGNNDANDGSSPIGPLVSDGAGNFYGVTRFGGINNTGTIFKITNAGVYSQIHSFDGAIGTGPFGGLRNDGSGIIYGVTQYGGENNKGTIFKIDNSGNYSLVYSFLGGNNGERPNTSITSDGAGSLYGATWRGGAGNIGVIYKISINP